MSLQFKPGEGTKADPSDYMRRFFESREQTTAPSVPFKKEETPVQETPALEELLGTPKASLDPKKLTLLGVLSEHPRLSAGISKGTGSVKLNKLIYLGRKDAKKPEDRAKKYEYNPFHIIHDPTGGDEHKIVWGDLDDLTKLELADSPSFYKIIPRSKEEIGKEVDPETYKIILEHLSNLDKYEGGLIGTNHNFKRLYHAFRKPNLTTNKPTIYQQLKNKPSPMDYILEHIAKHELPEFGKRRGKSREEILNETSYRAKELYKELYEHDYQGEVSQEKLHEIVSRFEDNPINKERFHELVDQATDSALKSFLTGNPEGHEELRTDLGRVKRLVAHKIAQWYLLREKDIPEEKINELMFHIPENILKDKIKYWEGYYPDETHFKKTEKGIYRNVEPWGFVRATGNNRAQGQKKETQIPLYKNFHIPFTDDKSETKQLWDHIADESAVRALDRGEDLSKQLKKIESDKATDKEKEKFTKEYEEFSKYPILYLMHFYGFRIGEDRRLDNQGASSLYIGDIDSTDPINISFKGKEHIGQKTVPIKDRTVKNMLELWIDLAKRWRKLEIKGSIIPETGFKPEEEYDLFPLRKESNITRIMTGLEKARKKGESTVGKKALSLDEYNPSSNKGSLGKEETFYDIIKKAVEQYTGKPVRSPKDLQAYFPFEPHFVRRVAANRVAQDRTRKFARSQMLKALRKGKNVSIIRDMRKVTDIIPKIVADRLGNTKDTAFKSYIFDTMIERVYLKEIQDLLKMKKKYEEIHGPGTGNDYLIEHLIPKKKKT